MTNVVDLERYRTEAQRTAAEAAAKAADLVKMPYDEICRWAGADFERLCAVAEARDYRPEWIGHQIENAGAKLTAEEAARLAQMIAEAGPYLSRRERWVMNQLRAKPASASALTKAASKSAEYRGFKHPDRCVAHDLGKLVSGNLIQTRGGLVYYALDSESGAAQAQPRQIAAD